MNWKTSCWKVLWRCATSGTHGIPAWNSAWAVGSFGYFPSYALGAVMAAQFYDAVRESVPDVEHQIARGDFSGLMGWLRQNVHGQGARVSAQELLKLSTGKPLSAASALRYLESKYLEPETVVGSAAA